MDKILRGLAPNKTYKIRYRAVFNDDTESAPTIAYSITTPEAPTPPKVDQSLITVDSQSLADGIIVSWITPDPDPAKPAVFDYFIQITDDPNDWQKFEIATTETKTIFTENNHVVFFGDFKPIIYIRVFSRGINKQFSELDQEEYYEYSYAVESGLRPPDIFVGSSDSSYSYSLSWAYLPTRPEIVTAYKIYFALLNEDGLDGLLTTISDETQNEYISLPDIELGNTNLRFAITALDAQGNESNPKFSNKFYVSSISVDTTPPPQRNNIQFTADTDSSDIIATWENPTDEVLNSDLSGVTIRYSTVADPTNYFWMDVPYKYTDNIDKATIKGLIPNTTYELALSTYDDLFNRTPYEPTHIVITNKDNIPPPKSAPPRVLAGFEAGGPMTVRVQQYSREPLASDINNYEGDPSKPLPLDTLFFQIWMLNSGFTSAPSGETNPNATQIGTLICGFGGMETYTIIYNSGIPEGETRYFYTRAVDSSGNISVASNSVQSTGMTILSDAHIKNLSANKILTGTLSATEVIYIGTGSGSIKLDGDGRIHSGVGNYGQQDTGFYLDNSGNFSLKDRLKFNGTTLSITGDITAQSGSFTGNIGLSTGGSLYSVASDGAIQGAGAPKKAIIFNSNGLAGYDANGNTTFALTTATGALQITGQVTSTGLVVKDGLSNFTYTRYTSGTDTSVTDKYALLSEAGKDLFLKSSGSLINPSKIRWLDYLNKQRGSLGWEIDEETGDTAGDTIYNNTVVLRANAIDGSPSDISGQILIHAQGPASKINLKAGQVLVNNQAIETPTEALNRYKNGVSTPGVANVIKYGTAVVETAFPTGAAHNGDIYLKY